MSAIDIEVKITKDIDVKQIHNFADYVIEQVANGTLDYTLADNRFPVKTGNLQRSSMAHRARKDSYCVYCLDAPVEAPYAKYVWEFPQGVSWTNPDTYSKWFVQVYKEKNDLITNQAVNDALRRVK